MIFCSSDEDHLGSFGLKQKDFTAGVRQLVGLFLFFFRVSEIRCGTQTLFVLSCTAKNALGR